MSKIPNVRANDIQEGGNHYKNEGLQHWDLMEALRIPYLEGNATKYIGRHHKKAGLQDLRKCYHYTLKLLELIEEDQIDETYSPVIRNLPRQVELMKNYIKSAELDEKEGNITILLLKGRNKDNYLRCLDLLNELAVEKYGENIVGID